MNLKQMLFGPRTVTALGSLLLLGLALQLAGWLFAEPSLTKIGVWLAAPFLLLVALLLFVVVPFTWFTSRRR